MERNGLVTLNRDGIPASTQTWADFGAGRRNFTWVLRDIVDANAVIYAVDRHAGALENLRRMVDTLGTVHPVRRDINQALILRLPMGCQWQMNCTFGRALHHFIRLPL